MKINAVMLHDIVQTKPQRLHNIIKPSIIRLFPVTHCFICINLVFFSFKYLISIQNSRQMEFPTGFSLTLKVWKYREFTIFYLPNVVNIAPFV